MIRNYLKVAWRHLWTNKTFSAINILGLSLGMVSVLLIVLHVKDELSYDKGFSKADRLFRITQEGLGDDVRHWAATSPALADAMQQAFPELEHAVHFYRPYPSQVLSFTPLKGEAKRFDEKGGFFADTATVSMFDISFVRGNAGTALVETNAIVLTQDMARRYFGDEDPLGKTIVDEGNKLPLKVTGVVKPFAFNTHLRFDYLVSMNTVNNYIDKESLKSKSWNGFYTYVQLGKNAKRENLEARLADFTANFFSGPGATRQQVLAGVRLHLQPVGSIHLYSKLEKEMYPNSDITYVYIFSLAALFILLVAAINFINISTAQAFGRMKEIGLRKVIGGTKLQLIRQFLGESFLVTLFAMAIALLLFKWMLPFYNDLAAKHLQFVEVLQPANLALLVLLIITIGLLSGLYPAWFVSNFNPISSLKGQQKKGSAVGRVRMGLIVFQFVVSVFMIFSTLTIYRQMRLFHNRNLGFDKEQLMAVTMYPEMWSSYPAMINDLKKNDAVAGFSTVSTLPGERFSMQGLTPLAAAGKDNIPGCRTMWSDDHLLSTLGVSLVEGRNFFNQFPDIKNNEFLLNETAVKAFQLKDPIGQKFVLDRDTGSVVGIIRDFNFASLHAPVEPLVIQYNPNRANYLLIKVKPGQLESTVGFLAKDIKKLSPASVFNYTFVDDKLNLLYESENRMSTVFKVFAAFALFISCLGLFGLSAYSTRVRTKEIGIRKVLGASVPGVAVLLSKDFIKLVAAAILIACPIAWLAMSKWLNGFAYHVNIGWWTCLIAAVLALVITALTVGLQVVKAAIANPVQSLRSE